MLTTAQVSKYLNRIGCDGDVAPSLRNLAAMQRRHLLSVPYENLDLLNGVPLSLSTDNLFHKIIEGKRGGYCFELQGLFLALLTALGYQVTQYAGRFPNEPPERRMRRHRVLVVDLGNGRYMVDVGPRGESPRRPLRLTLGIAQSDGVCQYRWERDEFYGWLLWQKPPSATDWQAMLGFTEEPQIDLDYVMPSFFCERHPDSTFNKFMKVSRFTVRGNVAIVGNTLKAYEAGRLVEERELETHAEAVAALRESFGIRVPDAHRRLLCRPSATFLTPPVDNMESLLYTAQPSDAPMRAVALNTSRGGAVGSSSGS